MHDSIIINDYCITKEKGNVGSFLRGVDIPFVFWTAQKRGRFSKALMIHRQAATLDEIVAWVSKRRCPK